MKKKSQAEEDELAKNEEEQPVRQEENQYSEFPKPGADSGQYDRCH